MKETLAIGTRGYLRQYTGDYYVDMVKRPYTVIEVSPSRVIVQSAKLVYPIFHYDPTTMSDYYRQFDNRRVCFFDTVAESIEPNPDGNIETLTWHPKKKCWATSGPYPEYFIAGEYEHQPYLN